MPLLRKPTTQELEDHFFGSGAFQFGWFTWERPDDTPGYKFPIRVVEWDDAKQFVSSQVITEELFKAGIMEYSMTLPDRTFDDLIEDMDAKDVDNVIQLIMFGEIRYS